MVAIRKKRKKLTRQQKDDAIFVYLIMIWPLIHFLVFTVYLNFSMIYNAFCQENIKGDLVWVGWSNFRLVLGRMFGMFGMKPDGIIGPLAWWNSFSTSLLAIFINTPITLAFSYMIYKKIPGYQFFRVVLFIPAITSVVVLALAYKLMLDTQVGIIPAFLEKIGLAGIVDKSGGLLGGDSVWTWIMIFNVWTGISGNLVYFSSAMARVPGELLESTEIDGATEFRQFFSVILPLIWPTVTTMLLSLVSATFTWMMPSLLLTGGTDYRATSLGLIITTSVRNGNAVGFIPALGIVIGILGSIFMLFVKKGLEQPWKEVEY